MLPYLDRDLRISGANSNWNVHQLSGLLGLQLHTMYADHARFQTFIIVAVMGGCVHRKMELAIGTDIRDAQMFTLLVQVRYEVFHR